MVVEDGAAARQRELCEPGAGRCVLGLGVEPRPQRIELFQPGKEIGFLCPGAGQRLKQMVVRVDQRGRDDRARQVLAPLGRCVRADLGDEAVLDPDPARGEFCPRVVHRDDVGVGEDSH